MRTRLVEIIEALLQASSEPLSTAELVDVLQRAQALQQEQQQQALPALEGLKEADVAQALNELKDELESSSRAMTLKERATGYKLVTKAEFAPYVQALFEEGGVSRLSPAAMETLAIIAYRQPVTKAMIEQVRGVSVDAMVNKLIDCGFVRICGRSELPGRALLYETSAQFLDHFALKSADELPHHQELSQRARELGAQREPSAQAQLDLPLEQGAASSPS